MAAGALSLWIIALLVMVVLNRTKCRGNQGAPSIEAELLGLGAVLATPKHLRAQAIPDIMDPAAHTSVQIAFIVIAL